MYAHVKVAVLYQCDTAQVCRLALAASEGAWDAGAEVRVRRLGRRAERIPQARPADLDWADVALFGTATPYGVTLDALTRYVDAVVPLWRAGRLREKVYGAFTAAASVRGGPTRRLASLADVFQHWGGIIVPLAGRDPLEQPVGGPDAGRPLATIGSPFELELAAARHQGRRATELAAALQVGQRFLADVA